MVAPTLNAEAIHQVFEEYKHRQVTLTILGSGAWGTALGHIANANDHHVRIWSRRSDMSLEEAIDGAEVIVSAISMKGVPELVQRL
jgi:glycerol-3-phosphate dehydrogenase (NAD(P)+)